MGRRFAANRDSVPRWLNLVRGVSSEGSGRLKQFRQLRRRLDSDGELRAFLDRESDQIPAYYTDLVRKDLGMLWKWLPAGALEHDPQIYLKNSRHGAVPVPTTVAESMPRKGLAGA